MIPRFGLARGTAVTYYGRRGGPLSLVLRRQEVHLRALDPALAGLSILHLSDLHFRGPEPWKQHALDQLQPLAADLVVFTGDFIDGREGIAVAADVCRRLRGRLGTYAVLGNHDYQSYRLWQLLRGLAPQALRGTRRTDTGELIAALGDANVTVLCNASRRLRANGAPFWVIGVDDTYSGRMDFAAALGDVEGPGLRLLLAHSPDAMEGDHPHGLDLVLAGHTHGGQIRLPGLGAMTTGTRLRLPRAAGVMALNGTVLHVSAGVGASLVPLRLFCPPEVSLLTLRPTGPGSQPSAVQGAQPQQGDNADRVEPTTLPL